MRNDVFSRPTSTLSDKERREQIYTLERERERLNRELEELAREYAAAVGSRESIRRARRIGTGENDWSYWHKD